MDKRYLMYGGAAVAVAAGAYMLLNRGASASDGGGDTSYYPPVVYGGATSTPASSTDTSGGSTDSYINQVLANNLSIATMQNNLSMAQLQADREIALKGYENDLATTKLKTGAQIEASLASQLGAIAQSMVSKKGGTSSSKSGFLGIGGKSSTTGEDVYGLNSISGTIGFDMDTGTISLDLARNVSQQLPANIRGQTGMRRYQYNY